MCVLFLGLGTFATAPVYTGRQEQTVTLAYYQGLNLEQDEVVSTPEVISVVFCGPATEPFVPALDRDLYAFPLADRIIFVVQAYRRGSWR
ncbi:hypothetical protein U27_05150 [Candidatus Vecturithrix granuli]|uniref:Uncharacterized protein n=1 Tax=Vecturithrix granuli TaxID=1499967 RepID=A0A081C0S2_VECG1|nr:hypothetical protein U27_05150 [Candidatus Vecturithrix granuli]